MNEVNQMDTSPSDSATARALAYTFDRQRLRALAEQLHDEFVHASPFQHIKIDDFLPDEVLRPVLAEFPEGDSEHWERFARKTEVKLALADVTRMGPVTGHLLAEFNGQCFMEFLTELTGIDGLIADHTFAGGGLHQIRPGGFLRIHADFNRHSELRLDRRLNALLYLNPDWRDEYGGNLELWDRAMEHRVASYAPIFNRLVIFATTDFAYHGHPDPLTCPPTRARRSMALYYYTNGRPDEEVAGDHTTLFRQRPGERFKAPAKVVAERCVPPILMDLVRRRRQRG